MGLIKFKRYVGERLQLGMKSVVCVKTVASVKSSETPLCLMVKRATLFLQVRYA